MTMSKWLTRFSKNPGSEIRLVCFPHAGGGAAAYYKLAKQMPDWLEVVAIVPPGREARIREPFAEGILEMAQGAAAALVELPPLPQVFFGHSMGVLVAFEAAHILSSDRVRIPRHLFLSGRRAHGAVPGESLLSGLPADEFIRELSARYGGISRQILDDKELLGLFLPVIRADIAAIERYAHPPRPALSVSVTLIGGHDDPQSTDEAWEGWKNLISGGVESIPPSGRPLLPDQSDSFPCRRPHPKNRASADVPR